MQALLASSHQILTGNDAIVPGKTMVNVNHEQSLVK
jgi:hypothetical protein